jgi:glycosyltransferase involved in cell wall biosynthesis
MKNKILIIEYCNFTDYPIGGHLSFAKQMIRAFGNEIAVVGIATDSKTPIGKWIKKDINNIEYNYFAVKRIKPLEKKGLIPARIKIFFDIHFYKSKILSIDCKNLFIQVPEIYFIFRNVPDLNICLRLPGLVNPLKFSRYPWARPFAAIYENIFFKSLNKANLLLAAANKNAINDFVINSKNKFDSKKLIQFATRYDDLIFYPRDKQQEKEKLNLPQNKTIIVTSGRLNEYKGWKFMIDSFNYFKQTNINSILIFLGDGEDKEKIQVYINQNRLIESVLLLGKVDHVILSAYLNASDLYIMGSYFEVEGWATSLVEAVASGIPICTTNFSSAKELVEEGVNGFVVDERNEIYFAEKMNEWKSIETKNLISKATEIKTLAVSNLKNDILKYWKLM